MKYMEKLGLIIMIAFCSNAYGQSCSDIKADKDNFHGVITYRSPVLAINSAQTDSKTGFSVFATRQVADFGTEYSLMFFLTSPNLDLSGHGIVLMLEDGAKIDKPQINLIFEGGSEDTFCKYSAKMVIEENELELLLNHKITGLRFFAYEAKHAEDFNMEDRADNINGEILFYLNCMANNAK